MSQIEKAEKQQDQNKDDDNTIMQNGNDVLDEDQIDGEFDDFLKQGGLDVDEMAAPKEVAPVTVAKEDSNDKEEDEEMKEVKDTEPDENMKGYLNKQSNKLMNSDDQSNDVIQNVVGGIGDSLKFGAKMLKDTVGKAVPISKLEKEYFALKNGVLYWYQNERARKAKGQIVVRNIGALEINPKNKLEITLLYQKKVYKLQSLDTVWQA